MSKTDRNKKKKAGYEPSCSRRVILYTQSTYYHKSNNRMIAINLLFYLCWAVPTFRRKKDSTIWSDWRVFLRWARKHKTNGKFYIYIVPFLSTAIVVKQALLCTYFLILDWYCNQEDQQWYPTS